MSLPQGITAKEEKVISDRINVQNQTTKYPIGIRTPLQEGKINKETLFRMNFDIENQIKDNLKNLLMTKKGEKLCFSDYGTSLYEIYASDLSIDEVYEFAMNEISEVVRKYMPAINLVNYYSSLLQDEEEIRKIQENKSQIERIKRGQEFHSIQNTFSLTKNGSIDKVSDANEKNDLIYLITVEYSIPKLDPEKFYSITMNLITSK
tara:strand:+ start:693 stop:1310 length:618 start_codon:yes stop_codon:yes gene_type:complete